MELPHLISTQQVLSIEFLDKLFVLADQMATMNQKWETSDILKWKILASLFYEPSTRTRFSFESAMLKLWGNVITTENAVKFSSAIKGEILEDTIKILWWYSDIIVLRHFLKGSAKTASESSPVPVVNAGDGDGEHPTQALLDIYTIYKECQQIEWLNVALIGDLRYGRTIHSLIPFLGLFEWVNISLVAPKQLELPEIYKEYLDENNISYKEYSSIDEITTDTDVFYVTRVQRERFDSMQDYESLKDSYVINNQTLEKIKKDAVIMHPLPRVTEIAVEVDKDPRAAYFRQAVNGLYIRMALLEIILGN